MGRHGPYEPGSFYRTDDRTGFPQRAERTRKEWNGLIVDETVWEARQPQDLVKGVKDDQSVPEARPLAPNVFVGPTFVQLSEAAVVTADIIEVQSTAGFSVGLIIAVMLDTGVLFLTSVAAVGAGEVFLVDPLPASAASGNLVTNYHRFVQTPASRPENTGLPAISGAAIEGRTLSCSTGTWLNDPIHFDYQWTRDGAPILLATSFLYVVLHADVGHEIACIVTASNVAGPTSATAPFVTPIATGVPTITTAPAITGSTVENGTGTVSTGVWDGAPTGYTAQWYRGAAPIMGATGFTYVYVTADVGENITAQVIASNVSGPSDPATSNTVVPTAAPSGIPIPNQAALIAMFNAGVGASGGKTYLLAAATSFGATSLSNYDFSSDPIIIIGQAGTVFTSLRLSAVKGVTWDNFNVEGSAMGTGVTLVNGCAHVAFNLVTSNPATPDGNGFAIDSSSFITINGASDAAAPDINNRGAGVVVTDSTSITLNGLTLTNCGPDGILMAGVDTIVINACLGFDWTYDVGDHPDFIQGFTSFHSGNGNTNVTITNSGWLREDGLPAQCYFFESTSNLVLSGNYGFGAFFNVISQSGGATTSVNDNFGQGFGDYTAEIVIRDTSVDAAVTNNTIEFVNNVGTNPGYTASGNTIIGPTTAGDYTDLDIWLAAHPSARARPI